MAIVVSIAHVRVRKPKPAKSTPRRFHAVRDPKSGAVTLLATLHLSPSDAEKLAYFCTDLPVASPNGIVSAMGAELWRALGGE